MTQEPARVAWGTFNAAAIVERLIYAGVAVFFYITTSASKVDATALQLGSFKAEMIDRLQTIQIDAKQRFEDLSRAVQGLPDQSALVRQMEARIVRLEQSKQDRDKQMADLTGMIMQDHADVASMSTASHQKLGR